MCIARRRAGLCVAEQSPDDGKTESSRYEERSKAVPQVMDPQPGDARAFLPEPDDLLAQLLAANSALVFFKPFQ